MAISVYAGKTGSGKSYNAVSNVIIPALASGRTVVTNVTLNKAEIFSEYPNANLITLSMDVDKAQVEKQINMANFPAGSVYVWDEAGKMFPTGWKQNLVPVHVLKFFTEHRHSVSVEGFSGEVFLLCQDVSQLAKWIRDLVQQTYIHEKLDKHGAANKFRVDIYDGPVATNRGRSIEKIDSKLGTYKPEIYRFYSSYTQSESLTDTALEDNPDKRASYVGKYKLYTLTVVIGMPLAIWMFLNAFHKMFGDDQEVIKQEVAETVQHVRELAADRGQFNPKKAVVEDTFIPGYEKPDYYELPWSKEWRLTGMIRSKERSFALVSNKQRTRRIELFSNCYFERDNREFICLISGELVASFTGPSYNEAEDIAPDIKETFGAKTEF